MMSRARPGTPGGASIISLLVQTDNSVLHANPSNDTHTYSSKIQSYTPRSSFMMMWWWDGCVWGRLYVWGRLCVGTVNVIWGNIYRRCQGTSTTGDRASSTMRCRWMGIHLLALIDSGGRRCICGMSYQPLQMVEWKLIFFLKKTQTLLQWPGLVISIQELTEICGLFIQIGSGIDEGN